MAEVSEQCLSLSLRLLLKQGLTLRLYESRSGKSFRESIAPGYSPVSLSEWEQDGRTAEHPRVEFVFTGPGNPVAGWYLTTADGTLVGSGEVNGGQFDVERLGDTVRVTPRLGY